MTVGEEEAAYSAPPLRSRAVRNDRELAANAGAMTGDRRATGQDLDVSAERLTATECFVLGMLSRGERSGYEISGDTSEGAAVFWTPARSQVYAVLPRLVNRGFATVRHVEQSDRPDKLIHRITPAGEQALRDGLEQDFGYSIKDPLLLMVAFGKYVSRERLVEQINLRRMWAAERIENFERAATRLGDTEEDFFRRAALKAGIERAHGTIRWAEETLRALERRDVEAPQREPAG